MIFDQEQENVLDRFGLRSFAQDLADDPVLYAQAITTNIFLGESDPEIISIACAISQLRADQQRTEKRSRVLRLGR